jgi:hypothetical protein
MAIFYVEFVNVFDDTISYGVERRMCNDGSDALAQRMRVGIESAYIAVYQRHFHQISRALFTRSKINALPPFIHPFHLPRRQLLTAARTSIEAPRIGGSGGTDTS